MKLSGLSCILSFTLFLAVSCSNDAGEKETGTTDTATPGTGTVETAPSVAKEKRPDIAVKGLKGKVEVLSESIYTPEGSGKKLASKNVFKYDVNGNRTDLSNYNKDGKMNSTIKSLYDATGRLTSEQTILADGTVDLNTTIKTDDKGNRIEQNDTRVNGASPLFNFKYFYKYDEKGHEKERAVYRENGAFLFRYTFNYDARGNKTEWIQSAADGTIIGKVIYKYDDKNNLIEETVYGKTGELKSTFTYSYEFDKKGNWIRQNKMQDGKVIEIKERKITYD